MKIKVIHGPNLQLLGRREKDIYGELSLDEINSEISKVARSLGLDANIDQYNSEGDIVDAIGNAASKGIKGIIINPAAYTHTSIAILDAIRGCGIPVIEVHLSNIASREEYRKHSVTAEAVVGQISGFGKSSYLLALQALKEILV
ncbi:MAG: type II 3-dehydroquinate dehydratase [Candidatus Omnitrophica bacterium]|nr:type II 3-dehydroquinate dehydratase [Candidatus Omnitrophota bacterium]